MDDYDSLLPPFPKSSNWSSVVCDVSMKLSRRLKRRMDRAWASSRGGGGWRTIPATMARPVNHSQRDISQRVQRTKIRRSRSIEEDGSTRRNRISHDPIRESYPSPPPLPSPALVLIPLVRAERC